MASIVESPSRARNAFLDRYITTLKDDGRSVLKPVSPSRINKTPQSREIKQFSRLDDNDVLFDENALRESTSRKSQKASKLEFLALSPQKTSIGPSEYSNDQISSISASNSGHVFDVKSLSSRDAKYYEFMCRVAEAKDWIECIIKEETASVADLASGAVMRDGVFLAKLTQAINPSLVKKIVGPSKTLNYTHTQNINAFFTLVESAGVPELFRFELTDLYDRKDIPKVFETIHALANIISKKWPGQAPEIKNLSGRITFGQDELKACQRRYPTIHNFRSFKATNSVINVSPNRNGSKGLITDFSSPASFDKSPQRSPRVNKEVKRISDDPASVDGVDLPVTPTTPTPHREKQLDFQLPKEGHLGQLQASSENAFSRNLQDTAPSLTYSGSFSPEKSLLYYSPTISRHLSYDTGNWASKGSAIDFYDTATYSKPFYSPTRQKRMNELEFLDMINCIQAICRGVNLRFNLLMRKRKFEIVSETVQRIQASARGMLTRKSFGGRIKISTQEDVCTNIMNFQAIMRGKCQRDKFYEIRFNLVKFESALLRFQNRCCCAARRKKYARLSEGIGFTRQPLAYFQSILKGKAMRLKLAAKLNPRSEDRHGVVKFQSFVRGIELRKSKNTSMLELHAEFSVLVQFQALIKGFSKRRHLATIKSGLGREFTNLQLFVCVLKARQERLRISQVTRSVKAKEDPISYLQANIKGVLARYALELIDGFVEYHSHNEIISTIRGALVRARLRKMNLYYVQHTKSIIKLQSKIRACRLRWAYLEFMSSGNPSLWSVKRFAHLLNQIYTSHESQSDLEELKSMIDLKNKEKGKLEAHLQRLNAKRLILAQNRILVNTTSTGPDFDIMLANVESTFPFYGKIFYLLQADSFYWKLLFQIDRSFSMKYVSKSFSWVNGRMNRREQVFFVKLVADIMDSEIEKVAEVTAVIGDSEPTTHCYSELLGFYASHQIPDLLLGIIQPALEYLDNPHVSFEFIPSEIYKEMSSEHLSISSSEAIGIPEVKEIFIKNLMDIWASLELIKEGIERLISKPPDDLKYLCTKAYHCVADRSSSEEDALLAISHILIDTFVARSLKDTAKFGLKLNSPDGEKKLSTLAFVVKRVFSFQIFEGYLSPLNQYSEQIRPDIVMIHRSMLTSPVFESNRDKLLYYDMYQDKRPTLSISRQYILDITTMLERNAASFPHDDPLHALLKGIRDNGELRAMQAYHQNLLLLNLDSTALALSSSDQRLCSIYNEIKRGLTYMMQVEDVDTNLYDLLTGSVLEKDEPVFQKLLKASPAIKRDPLMKELKELSYFALKEHVLERTCEFKRMNDMPANDSLQGVLNDIANTIKSRDFVKNNVTVEVQIANKTLEEIGISCSKLQKTSKALEGSIRQAIQNAQRGSNFEAPRKHGFGNKLKSAYKKVQTKSSKSSSGLSFQYTARQLYEHGALLKIDDEKLGKAAVAFFGSSGPKFPDIQFKISTSDGETFSVEMTDQRKSGNKLSITKMDTIALTKLLDLATDGKQSHVNLIAKKITLDASKFLGLLTETFFKRLNASR
ncbi:LAMI_0C02564g1_1 [Lachancea mirantina]|uniref:LAMI_0C02564g1_1 n=1 Tax=Lachancea mirantina TaxID=1230905 RepID=A0A1G4J1N9_9SACH|nr:LAMI_0C02564g1_1 [Lachancea mirantina]